MAIPYKIGFIGFGNLAQAITKGLLDNKTLSPHQIYASNRSQGKLLKAQENLKINICGTNEELVDSVDVVVLSVKPQDLNSAIDPVISVFHEKQIVVSLLAGISLRSLEKKLPHCRIVRLMPNTPALISRGIFGFLLNKPDQGLQTLIEDICSPLGYTLQVDDEEQLESLMISTSSGVGFVFELMSYWQDWIEERGFDPQIARKMTVETFLGASQLAALNLNTPIEDLLGKVASKKGVTAAGLQSMRELEIERALRYSFEKSALRNQELAKES